jgi:large subunit ribosomal protein L9
LFGSVSTRDVAALLSENGLTVSRSQIALNSPIKAIGLHKVPIALHPEIEATIIVNVARSPDEAQRIARGEDVTTPRTEAEEEGAAAQAAAEAFFENPEDAEKQLNAEESTEAPAESETTAKS